MSRTFREHIESLLRIPPDSKPEIYREVFNSSETVSLNYALGLLFSAGIATLGLVLNSSAVVIGAMLISPLMGPILAAGLALAASDLYLGIKSLLSLAIGVVFAILFSAGLVWILPIQTATSEILARTQPNLLDLGVALISGLAGSVVVCRRGAGGRRHGAAGRGHRGRLDASALHRRIRRGKRVLLADHLRRRPAVPHQPGRHHRQRFPGVLRCADGRSGRSRAD